MYTWGGGGGGGGLLLKQHLGRAFRKSVLSESYGIEVRVRWVSDKCENHRCENHS